VGIVPVRLFCSTARISRDATSPKRVDRLPDNILLFSSILWSMVASNRASGIDPIKLFSVRSSSIKLSNIPKDAGIIPASPLLEDRVSSVSASRLANSSGMLPTSVLLTRKLVSVHFQLAISNVPISMAWICPSVQVIPIHMHSDSALRKRSAGDGQVCGIELLIALQVFQLSPLVEKYNTAKIYLCCTAKESSGQGSCLSSFTSHMNASF